MAAVPLSRNNCDGSLGPRSTTCSCVAQRVSGSGAALAPTQAAAAAAASARSIAVATAAASGVGAVEQSEACT